MRVIQQKIRRSVRIREDSVIAGIIEGDVTVDRGKSLKVAGMIVGNLLIRAGAKATIIGTVIGDVENKGYCDLQGIVKGSLFEKGGHFRIGEHAVLASKRS